MKAVVAAFNQEKALVGAFSVITNLRMELFEALVLMLVSSVMLMMMPRDPRPAPRPCRGRVRWAGRVAAAKCRHYHAKHTAAAIKIPRPGDTPLKRNIL